jgi:hypothetical protein
MDDIISGVTLEAVTKLSPVEKRRRLFKSSEWDLEEPAAFTRIARSPIELALITGVVIRLFRAVVLTHGEATSSFLGASLVLGTLFLLGMATLHLGSLALISLHREPWGTARAEFTDWQPMATGVLFWRVIAVCLWALLLGGTVQFVRGRVLKDTGREVEPQTLPDGQPFIERRKRDEF